MAVVIIIGIIALIIFLFIAGVYYWAYCNMLVSDEFKKIKEDYLEEIKNVKNGKYDIKKESYYYVKIQLKTKNRYDPNSCEKYLLVRREFEFYVRKLAAKYARKTAKKRLYNKIKDEIILGILIKINRNKK